MINGYEEVFGINGFSKKFDLIEEENLFHRMGSNGPEANITSTGRSACSLFYCIVEQIVGKDVYETFYEAHYLMENFCEQANRYSKNKLERESIHALQQERDAIAKQIEYLGAKISTLSETEKETLTSLIARHSALEEQFASKSGSFVDMSSEELDSSAKAVLDIRQKIEDGDLNSKLAISIEQLMARKEEVIQALVDTTLLPGQEKDEARVRQCAEAMFKLSIVELQGLSSTSTTTREMAEYITSLGHVETLYFEKPIPKNLTKRLDAQNNITNLITLAQDTSFNLFSDEKYSNFVIKSVEALEEVEFGRNGTISEHDIFTIGTKECDIPARTIKHLFGGYKLGMDQYDCLTKIVPKISQSINEIDDKNINIIERCD